MTDENLTPNTDLETEDSSGFRSYLTGQPKWLLASLGAVITAIVMIAGVLIWYVVTRSPVTDIPGITINTPPGFSYTIAGVEKPLGIAYDEANDRLYITQSGGDRTTKVFASNGAEIATLPQPKDNKSHTSVYVAVDPANGNVYVTDRGSMQVLVYNAAGELTGELSPDSKKGWAPLAVMVAADSKVYVTNTADEGHSIMVFAKDGSVVQTIGAKDKLEYPNGLVLQKDGSLVVADSNNSRVIVFNTDGTVRGFLTKGESPSQIGMPRGLAVGTKDRLYIADTVAQVIRVYVPDEFSGVPVYSTEFGEVGKEDGQFIFPNGIAVDTTGRIFVTDRVNNRVGVWKNK